MDMMIIRHKVRDFGAQSSMKMPECRRQRGSRTHASITLLIAIRAR
jgi:hypothetical protein